MRTRVRGLCGLAILCLFLIWPAPSFALDRAMAVHSRIESALSRILYRTDFLVIVNRLDDLEDAGANTATSGQVRRLPGLNAGVDGSGRVIRSDEAAGEYNGGVSISVVLDPEVREETYDLIQKSMPDLVGGLRDTDEFRISRSMLRQPPPPNSQAPQVAVNNNMGDPAKGTDLLRQLAIGLAFLGLFVWILSRLLNRSSKDSAAGNASPRSQGAAEAKDPAAEDERKKSEKHLAELDPELTGFYLIRAQANRQMDRIRTWSHKADPSTQRAMLRSLPGWMVSSLEKTLREASKDTDGPQADLGSVYLEISVLEQNLKDPAERQRALLSWFPATYLRDVPSHQRDKLSRPSRLVLWSLRPELGDFVKLENESYEEAIEEPSALAIQKCFAEMASWNSKEVVGERSQGRDAVEAIASMINQLKEFGPIESRLTQAREKLSADDFARLESKVVWVKTPLASSAEQAKDWLRQVEPQDYLWWLHLVGQSPGWKLEEMLRPLRLSMFKNAEADPLYPNWSETQRKAAAERILTQLREIHLAKGSGNAMAA